MAEPDADCRKRRLHAEMVAFAYANSRFGRLAGLMMLGLMAGLALSSGQGARLAVWLALALPMVATRLTWVHRHAALPRAEADAQLPAWERRAFIGPLWTGLVWAAAMLLFFRSGDGPTQGFLLAMAALVSAGSIGIVGSLRSAFIAQTAPAHLALALRFALEGAPMDWALACFSLAGVALFEGFASQFRRLLAESFAIRDEREQLLAELAARTAEAEAASRSKTRFLANASHDLRQPLHALGLMAATLQAESSASATAQRVAQMVTALDGLVAALLDISRLDAAAAPSPLRALALQPLFERLGDESALLADERGLQFRCRPTALVVRSDAASLERALRNLLANALRYTRAGGVLLAARRHGGRVQIGVWDTGPGIAEDQQAAVWEEFVQLDNPGRERAQGLGLGLAIVERLARQIGASVSLRSRPGRGSCFSLLLPAAPPDEPAAAAALAPADAAFEGRVVAFVEDDLEVRDATVELLQRWGCCVVAAADAAGVDSQLASTRSAPAVIVSDHRLARGDGLQAVAALRGRFGAALPAIIVSGDAPPTESGEGIVWARKPLSPASLRVLLADALR